MNRFFHISCFCKTLCFSVIFFCNLSAQTSYYKLGFTREQEIEVAQNSRSLAFPWAGGVNSVFFSQIDLNLDGISDFIAFEKHGNRILPFINEGTHHLPKFVYAPKYKHRFPELHDWVILKDFNNDGKADIFSYNGLGGVRVFENISSASLPFSAQSTVIFVGSSSVSTISRFISTSSVSNIE